MRSARLVGALALILASIALPARAGASPAGTAALQSALDQLGLYSGYVDGVRGPLTRRGVVAFQRQKGLHADGIAGPRTRRALGWRGKPRLGSRVMRSGDRGWDVAALQFLLQRAGHGAGRADGLFGPLTGAAVARAQSAAGLQADGLAGPATIRSLRGGGSNQTGTPVSTTVGGPVSFLRPVPGPIGDGFGVGRGGGRVHQGLDFPVPFGTQVNAAGVGTTIFAGYNTGGYGNLVVVQHRLGYTTWYAHLSSITTWVGEAVAGGVRIGYVGSTGYSTGPHLHFEVRRYDTPIDPLSMLLSAVSARASTQLPRASVSRCERAPGERRRGGNWIATEPLCVEG